MEKGKLVALLGPSGSGKTTLLRMIAGLENPNSGDIYIDGRRVNDIPAAKRGIGFVFQNYNLVPDLNVYENIVLPIELDGGYVDEKFIGELLDMLHLQEKAEALPGTLSGGQQQRVAIARALASKPAIILADEPTGNLDSGTGHEVLGLLRVAAKRFSQTLILITHDMDIAQLADRIVCIEDGKIRKGSDEDAEK